VDKKILTIKERILQYIENNGIAREKFFDELGISYSNFKGTALKSELGGDKIVRILTYFPDMNPDWLLTGNGEILRNNINQTVLNSPHAHINSGINISENQCKDTKNISNNGNVYGVINSGDNSPVDNRQYYSDSPDVLRAQVEEKNRLLSEKDERIREKDERIKELLTEKEELKEIIKELKQK
jgi:hypothetical protein